MIILKKKKILSLSFEKCVLQNMQATRILIKAKRVTSNLIGTLEQTILICNGITSQKEE